MSNWIKDYFQLPDNWSLEKLEDLTNLIIDGTHHTPTYTEYGVPFLRVTDVQTKEIDKTRLKYVSQKEHKFLIKRCNPEKGDILYSKNGTIGIPKIVDWDWEFSIFVSLALIKLKKGISPVYVKYLLQSDLIKKQIQRRAKQGTVINLHLEEIRELEVPRSSPEQENEIAKILTTIDSVLEKTETAIAKYEAIKQGMMHDLFTRGIGADGQLRPIYADAPELYKESGLGWIPREWEVEGFEVYCQTLLNGGTPSTKVTGYWKGTIPWVTGADFTELFTVGEIRRRITEQAVVNSATNVIEEGDILLVTRTGVGKLAVAPFKISFSQDITGMKINKEVSDTNFLFYYLQLLTVEFKKLNQGTSINGITRSDLINRLVILPKKTEQVNIANKLIAIDTKIKTEKSILSKQTQLKQGLMQDLLTGKVAVKADLVNA